ncbi:MAG: membrane protein insertion efficiency factor YidD [Candidatus Latescibacterota bacterium]
MISQIARSVLIGAVRLYQRILSPYFGGNCRYYPSCSEYAILSLKKNGAARGSLKTVWRLLRCNPFSKGGIDYP